MTCFVYIDSDAAVTMTDEDRPTDDVSTGMALRHDDSMTSPSDGGVGGVADSGITSNLSISIVSKVYYYKIFTLTVSPFCP